MHSEIHGCLRMLSCVEIKYLDAVISSSCEEMSSIREPDLSACLRAKFLVRSERLGEYIQHSYFVSKANDHMQPAGMECAAVSLFAEIFKYFKTSAFVVPDPHTLVNTACHE